jgi:hypothetical protein
LFVTGAAFAQVPDGFSIGGWGRADFVPVQGVFESDHDPVFLSGVGSGWGPAYMGLSLSYTGVDGRIGGQLDLGQGFVADTNGGITAIHTNGDNINVWAKPFGTDILYLKFGKMRDGRFRGPGTDGEFQGFIGGPGKNGDPVFQRFAPDFGALFISQPIAGLSIFAQVDTAALVGISPMLKQRKLGDGTSGSDSTVGKEAKDVYKKIQTGIAYDIAGIGLARAQWVGNSMTLGNAARIEAAFKLKAIDGLNLDVGVKLPIPVDENDTIFQDNFQLAAAGDFKAGDFGITYGLYGAFGGSYAYDGIDDRDKLNATFDLIVIPSFYIGAIDATVGADVGFKVKGESTKLGTKQKDQSTTFGFGGWISRDLGKGLIKTGLAYQLPEYANDGIATSTGYLSWPIILQISF